MKLTKGLFALLFLIVIGVSCNKKADLVGLGLQPTEDQLLLVLNNTTGISAYSILIDSVTAGNKSISLVGGVYDEVFGKTQGSTSFQINRTTGGTFPEASEVDSLILIIPYAANYYGDIDQSITLRLYEVLDDIEFYDISQQDTLQYYSDTTFNLNETEITSYNFLPEPDSTVTINGVKYDPQIRIPIDNAEFLDRLLNDASISDTNISFVKDVLKGLHLTSDVPETPGSGVLLGIKNRGSIHMNMYFTDAEGEVTAKRYDVSSNMQSVNHFDHFGYEDANEEFKQQLIEGDTTLGSDKIYVQSIAGVYSKIRLDGLVDWKEELDGQPVAVNEASLILYANSEQYLDLPDDILIIRDNGDNIALDVAENENGRYSFRIADLVQSIIQGEEEVQDLSIYISNASQVANTAIFNGINSEEYSLELRIIYTKL